MDISRDLLHQIVDMTRMVTLCAANTERVSHLVYKFDNGNSISVASQMGTLGHSFLSTMAIDANDRDGEVVEWQTPMDVAERMITLAE